MTERLADSLVDEVPAADPAAQDTASDRDPHIRVAFGRSIVRLSAREWLAVLFIVSVCLVAIPALWERFTAPISPDARIPYTQSEDYWAYEQLLKQAVTRGRIPVIGDSFVWGEYVPPEETLSSDLNAATGTDLFANVGLDGAHPLALAGFVQTYAGRLKDGRVLLHLNLLWMSSPERDLRADSDVAFNHPRLVPQFFPAIVSYKAPLSQRLAIVVDRHVSFFDLVNHVRTCWFDGRDVPSWSISHPYQNPLALLDARPAASRQAPRARPWTEQGIERQDLPWIDLDQSLQWRAWREAASTLRARGNRVLAVIGPFNEHLLLPPSRERYGLLKQKVAAWLKSEGIRSISPALLPSDEYGDASHPLSAGYVRLARSISRDPIFREWLGDSPR
jgi:hypothetical protein